MANINQFIPFVLKWEGGYVNDPNDLGSPTNRGVTLKTWQECGYDKNDDGIIDEEDLKQIFVQDVIECVLRPHYWNRWQADRIRNQSIANLLVDWLWLSGTTAIKTAQRLLNLAPDGIVGEKTPATINDCPDPKELFDRLKAERTACIEQICKSRLANRKYKKGRLNRLNDIKFAFTITVIETVTVRFDTASPDSITGKYLVKKITKSLVTRGKAVRSSSWEERENHRTDSGLVHNRETTDRKTAENIRTLAVGRIALKKITDFIYSREKNSPTVYLQQSDCSPPTVGLFTLNSRDVARNVSTKRFSIVRFACQMNNRIYVTSQGIESSSFQE